MHYSINLMWINAHLQPQETFICPTSNADDFETKLLLPLLKWAKANPEATINLWYDGLSVTETQLDNTSKQLEQLISKTEETRGIENIRLKNIRAIPIVQQNYDAFSGYVPIYAKVDILKVIICIDQIERFKFQSSVFSDLEVGDLRPTKDRMNKEELFNAEVLHDLIQVGLILNSSINIENQFLQMYNHDLMLVACKDLVNIYLASIISILNYQGPFKEFTLNHMADFVFGLLVETTFDYCKNYGNVKVPKYLLEPDSDSYSKEEVIYEPSKHGYPPFNGTFLCTAGRRPGIEITKKDGKQLFYKFPGMVFPDGTMMLPPSRKVDVRGGLAHNSPISKGYVKVTECRPQHGDRYTCIFWPTSSVRHVCSLSAPLRSVAEASSTQSGSCPGGHARGLIATEDKSPERETTSNLLLVSVIR